MKILTTHSGIRLYPEMQAEIFQLEILWSNRSNLKMTKLFDEFDSFDCLLIEVISDDTNNKQESR